MLLADIELARRLEMTDALAGVEFARACARRNSYAKEVAAEVAGGIASFGGVGSPLTQAFGLGLAGPVTPEDLERMEAFYRERGSAVNIETCPLADPSLFELLSERGYRSIEESNVFARELKSDDSKLWQDESGAVRIRTASTEEADAYSLVVSKSFFEDAEVPADLLNVFVSSFEAAGTFFFVAEIDGALAGGGMMSIHRRVASLGGAGTLREFRNRGAQNALIRARLARAAAEGCDLAMVATGLGTVSQRNVERQGFSLAYKRTKFAREW